MRTVKYKHQAVNAPIGDLITYRALPNQVIKQIDPFLFLNHHGFQVYPENNRGLPFGPHPHRGFETVTFILSGDLAHKDNSGASSIIEAGGVQWMTAGRGLIHAEVSSADFMKHGGQLEILQLWVNLPAKYKMVEPVYQGKQKNEIPTIDLEEGEVQLTAVSGNWSGTEGAFKPLVDIALATVFIKKGAVYKTAIAADHNIFFYVVKGAVKVNGQMALMRELVEFALEGKLLQVEAQEDSLILLGHAKPFEEPILAHGPFVMNTMDEIHQAYDDYNSGAFGTWTV
ncbi:redox-sensitive bicupin YhaK (pirin superfamily) [Pedobacter sp. CAN_A7]|uniref:pirin family protein n=1 Tax=Pedobacter sp. CAN_A7 TaxID=2787722 RepID=UPI0018C9CE60